MTESESEIFSKTGQHLAKLWTTVEWQHLDSRPAIVDCTSQFIQFWAYGGEKVPQNERFLALDADEPPSKI